MCDLLRQLPITAIIIHNNRFFSSFFRNYIEPIFHILTSQMKKPNLAEKMAVTAQTRRWELERVIPGLRFGSDRAERLARIFTKIR